MISGFDLFQNARKCTHNKLVVNFGTTLTIRHSGSWTRVIADAFQRGYFAQNWGLDSLPDFLRTSFADPNHPAPFGTTVEAGRRGLLDLAAVQLQIIDRHLKSDDEIRSAFEDFGQGILFDDRPPRPPGRRVHMMDGTPDNWVGWQRWHGFIRAASLLGDSADRWLHINRCMALSWAIQTEADPVNDKPDNPELPSARLDVLRQTWMTLTFEQLDWAFAKHRFRAPAPEAIDAIRSPNERGAFAARADTTPNYAGVQQIIGNGLRCELSASRWARQILVASGGGVLGTTAHLRARADCRPWTRSRGAVSARESSQGNASGDTANAAEPTAAEW